MNQETADLLFGAGVLVIFLVFVFALGKLIYSWQNWRLTRAWAPLIPLVNGTVTGDGGGAATSWLSGTYQGRRVQASMTPNRNLYSDDTGTRYNYFDVALLDVPGGADWRVSYETPILGIGRSGWCVTTQDKALETALLAAGVIPLVERFGAPTVVYEQRTQKLLYSEDVTPRWVPDPDRFGEELTLLGQLIVVNERVNPIQRAQSN